MSSISAEVDFCNDCPSRESVLSEIARTDNAIEELYNQRLRLNETLNRTASIMRILPLDMLVEIFYLAVEKQFYETVVGSGRVPFLLTMVCKSWRRIALQNPKIWSCIFLRYDTRSEDRMIPALETWIARSASSPLQIRLDHVYGSCPHPVRGLEMLLKEANRWRTFDSFYFPALLSSEEPVGSFPCLTSLSIRAVPKFTYTLPRPIGMFRGAPIRHLLLTEFSPRYLTFDHAHITNLSGRWDASELKQTLRHTPCILSCVVTILSTSLGTSISTMDLLPFSLQQLEVLDVQGHFSIGLISIFSVINTPQLKHLKFNDFSQALSPGGSWSAAICQMLDRSACRLETLWLVPNSDITGVASLFRVVPSIKQLTLQSRHPAFLNNALLDILKMLPNLTHLTLEGAITFEPPSLIHAIQSRNTQEGASRHVMPLKAISVKYTNAKWGLTFHPNILRDFFRDMMDLERYGVAFGFDCVDRIEI